MKFLQTRFEDYINKCKKNNIHKKMKPLLDSYGDKIENLSHLIFYGPGGIGKYTQSLNFIKKFSPSELKYERKINYKYNNKYEYTFKLSDVHFEIDMELLGCNAKLLFNELYYHILDVCNTRQRINNIIVCKNFHKIHTELLDNFYSYMQSLDHKNLNIIFILKARNIKNDLLLMSLICLCPLIFFPHSNYDYVLLLPLLVYSLSNYHLLINKINFSFVIYYFFINRLIKHLIDMDYIYQPVMLILTIIIYFLNIVYYEKRI